MSSSGNSNSKKPNKKFASLRDLERDDGGNGSDDDEAGRAQEYFAGGDKSGLAVRNPDDGQDERVQRLLQTARARGAMPRPPTEEAAPRPSRFTGVGQTLGGDDAPSQIIVPESGHDEGSGQRRPMAERVLHLWADGFSVDDGPLYRYDDPANQATLDMINRGAAPLELMNVAHGQDVDVKLMPHRGENYKAKYTPFSGSGQRLGSPTPGPSSSTAESGESSVPTNASTDPSTSSAARDVSLDESQPIITLQVRLGNGTRLQSRFNTTHTIGDVYSFVNSASAESTQRSYVLMTTFPSKELNDKEQVLGEMPDFKRGGVVVQKWQ